MHASLKADNLTEPPQVKREKLMIYAKAKGCEGQTNLHVTKKTRWTFASLSLPLLFSLRSQFNGSHPGKTFTETLSNCVAPMCDTALSTSSATILLELSIKNLDLLYSLCPPGSCWYDAVFHLHTQKDMLSWRLHASSDSTGLQSSAILKQL